jgi:hypothetical protein
MEIYVDYYEENAEIGNPRLVGLSKVNFQETFEKRPWPPSICGVGIGLINLVTVPFFADSVGSASG